MHFKDKLRFLDTLVSVEERIPDITRLALLSNAVENVPDLRRVRTMDQLFRMKSGATHILGYEEYFQLLMDAACQMDHAISTRGKRRNAYLHAQMHQQYDTQGDFDVQDEIENQEDIFSNEYEYQENEYNHIDINVSQQKKGNNKPVPKENSHQTSKDFVSEYI